uniref:Uncharacterized protein n=1 Tax=Daphnia magna TaxID=35525 RepID=A0A0P4XLF7_9CRUS
MGRQKPSTACKMWQRNRSNNRRGDKSGYRFTQGSYYKDLIDNRIKSQCAHWSPTSLRRSKKSPIRN